jgi:squalene synthase HpnC
MSASLQSAYDYCSKIARTHYENFPVGGVLIPSRLRKHFHALYAFMRTADDFADLPNRPPQERLALLGDWRSKLHSAFSAEPPSDPIFVALQDTVRNFNLSRTPFDLLLDAFDFDARGHVQFETYEDLHWYTRRSAEPVGQLVLALFGFRDTERIEWSNDICTALQLINFLQDAGEDLRNGRCYFPKEDCTSFGIESPGEFESCSTTGELILFECDRIALLLHRGSKLPDSVSGRLRLELRAVAIAARIMLDKIRVSGGQVLTVRPKLSRMEKLGILSKALVRGV